jgi:hypothetical protein
LALALETRTSDYPQSMRQKQIQEIGAEFAKLGAGAQRVVLNYVRQLTQPLKKEPRA